MQHFFEAVDGSRTSINAEAANEALLTGQIVPVIRTEAMSVYRSKDHAKLAQKMKPNRHVRYGGRHNTKSPIDYAGG